MPQGRVVKFVFISWSITQSVLGAGAASTVLELEHRLLELQAQLEVAKQQVSDAATQTLEAVVEELLHREEVDNKTNHCPVCDTPGPGEPHQLFQQLAWSAGGSQALRPFSEGSCNWYCDHWELDALVAFTTSVMLLFVVMFDVLYHACLHRAQNSYVYGSQTETREEHVVRTRERIHGKPLMESLIYRMGSEFMALGFLAFLIWICNELGFFGWLGSISTTLAGMRLPRTGAGYLHLAEEVHMELFIAMLIYFTFCASAIGGCISHTSFYEHLRNSRTLQRGHTTASLETNHNPFAHLLWTEAQEHRKKKSLVCYWQHFRSQALGMVMAWRELNPKLFEAVLAAAQIVRPAEEVTLNNLQSAFDDNFVFETYLAYAMRVLTEDMIAFSSRTMCAVAFLKFCQGMVCYVFEVGHKDLRVIITTCVVALAVLTWAFLERIRRRLRSQAQDPDISKHCSCFDTEVVVSRCFQGALFFYSFTTGFNLVQEQFWEAIFTLHFKEAGVWMMFASLVALYFLIWQIVPNAGQLLALPPFFDVKDQKVILRVLHGQSVLATPHLPAAQPSGGQQADGTEDLARAVRVLVAGESGGAPGLRSELQERFVVQGLVRLLTNWKNGIQMEFSQADRDTRIAQRLEDLSRVLEATAPNYDSYRERSQMARINGESSTALGREHKGSLLSGGDALPVEMIEMQVRESQRQHEDDAATRYRQSMPGLKAVQDLPHSVSGQVVEL